MFNNKTSQQRNMIWLAIIMIITGDLFYLGALLFKEFMVDFIMFMSPEFNPSDLNNVGKTVVVYLTSLLGTLLYLVGILLFALSKESDQEKRKISFYGIIVWFITDTLSSLLFGFSLNAIFNLGFLILGLIFLRPKKLDG